MGIFSSRSVEATYEDDEFTEDEMSEDGSSWLENEDRSLIDAILENTDWNEIADLLRDRDFDRTADECRDRWVELFMASVLQNDEQVAEP